MKLTTKKWTTAAAICAAGLCGAANAGPMSWTDTVNLTPAPLLTAFTPDFQLSYTHYIEGFNTATDTVDSFTLTFHLYDDEPEMCCDYVFITPDLVPRLKSIRIDAQTQASDHQPVVVELA